MQVLRLRKKTKSKVELAAQVIHTFCIFNDIKISKTELEVISYFAVYGFKKTTKATIVRSEILTANSLENTLSKLRKLGLVVKDKDNLNKLIDELNFTVENKMGIIIQLDNE